MLELRPRVLQHGADLDLEDLSHVVFQSLGMLRDLHLEVVGAVAEAAGNAGFLGFVHAAQDLEFVRQQALHRRDFGGVQHSDARADDVADIVPRVRVERLAVVVELARLRFQRRPCFHPHVDAVELHAGVTHQLVQCVAERRRRVGVRLHPFCVGGTQPGDGGVRHLRLLLAGWLCGHGVSF